MGLLKKLIGVEQRTNPHTIDKILLARYLGELLHKIHDHDEAERYQLVLKAMARAATIGFETGFSVVGQSIYASIYLPTGLVNWSVQDNLDTYEPVAVEEVRNRVMEWIGKV